MNQTNGRAQPGELNFAYGSNLDRDLMAHRCRGFVEEVGTARLFNYTLGFEGFEGGHGVFATVHYTERGRRRGDRVLAPYVEGVLYRITDARGWEGLDACEGVPTLYDRVSTLVVDHQGLTVNAWTYEHKGGFYGLPAPSYLRGIAREYTRLGFRHGVLTAAMLNAHRGFNRGAKVLK